MAVILWGSNLLKQKGLSSLTRIPLDSANVDIISGSTKSVLKLYVSKDIVNGVYKFPQTTKAQPQG